MNQFRFAVQVSNAADAESWRMLARDIESLGYSTLFIPDHFGDQFGPLVALTVASEATTSLKVGSLVFGNDYRHPVVLAKEIATLSLMSGGRVEFGLGAGWMSSDYVQSGISEDRAGVRVSRMAESLQIYKQMWNRGEASLAGDYYNVTQAPSAPLLPTAPPIIIGGGSPRVLGIAAREADIVGVNPNLSAGFVGAEVIESTTSAYFDERIQWIKAAAGERFPEIELQVLTFFVQITDDRATAIKNLSGLMGVSEEAVAETPIALIGTIDEIIETLLQRRERYGFSYIVVHQEEMRAFAPVVAALTGR
ncbi:MAG: TIGR03621 family F420-dependent LLM class oxidoreductase [Actinomycetota bacterium]|jgi:hypothetical protein